MTVMKLVLAGAVCGSLLACQARMPPHHSMGANGAVHGFNEVPEFRAGDVYEAPRALELGAVQDLDKVMPKLLESRVIYVGETHDRLDHHLNQLEIIRRVYADNPNLAIGMEFFQQPFQSALDDYIAGRSDEKTFLKASEYYLRWRIDYRHYRPIMQFAREKKIPVLALDVAEEVRRKIARGETSDMTDAERAQIPAEIDRTDQGYRDMLQQIFNIHPDSADIERFIETQLTRDEAMAQTASAWLTKNPGGRMVVLAGGGHLIYGYGIPNRVKRRTGLSGAIVINDSLKQYDVGVADYLLMPSPMRLPKEARMGVIIDPSTQGALLVTGFAEQSPAERAGIEAGDRLLTIDGQSVGSMAELKITLLDKSPGEIVPVRVQRKGWFGTEKELGFDVTLY